MVNPLDNAVLEDDLDCNRFSILNLGNLPAGTDFVDMDDSRLSDKRAMLPGSVRDSSFPKVTAIAQSKLNLNGALPPNFLGADDLTAAQGDLYQPKSQKGQPNGYAALGSDGKLVSGSVVTSGTGTVTDLDIEVPPDEFKIVKSSPSPHVWAFDVTLQNQPNNSWFGNQSGADGPPYFITDPFYPALIPGLPGSKFTTGTFGPALLPVAVGVGTNHAKGLMPDPGLDTDGSASDYLARDMTYKPMKQSVAYQPTIPNPSITVQSYFNDQANVNIASIVNGATIFYKTGSDPFKEPTKLPLLLSVGTIIKVYAAKIGYNNSEIVAYTVPPPGQT